MASNMPKGVTLGFSSYFLIFQNVIGALLSVPVLVFGIVISKEHRSGGDNCATFMDTPIIAVGALLLLVSLAGLIVAISDKVSKHPILAWFHLLLMFFLVILLFCFAIFCLDITDKDLAHNVNGYGQSYKEYRLNEYPRWMRHRVEDSRYWSKVKNCIQRASICTPSDLPSLFSNLTHQIIADLTPIQRGCCIPPSACHFQYLDVANAKKGDTRNEASFSSQQHDAESTTRKDENIQKSTTSTTTGSTIANDSVAHSHKTITKTLEDTQESSKASDNALNVVLHAYTHDCKHWSKLPNILCYDCDMCKAGILQDSMDRWKNAAILYVVLVVVMIILYALFACYGFKEHSREKL